MINGVNVLSATEIRNETKCKKIGTQTCISAADDTHMRPRREGPVISEQRERHPVAANRPLTIPVETIAGQPGAMQMLPEAVTIEGVRPGALSSDLFISAIDQAMTISPRTRT